MVGGIVVQQNKGTVNCHFFCSEIHDCQEEYILYCTNKGDFIIFIPCQIGPLRSTSTDCKYQLE